MATAADVEAELARIGYTLQSGDIVLVNTRAGEVFGQPGFVDAGCGMGREATLYLTERGVKIVGTDAWSWDAPFSHTAKKWAKDRDPKIIWEGHKAGREIPYWQMEKLANLKSLPPFGYEVICFPVKIKAPRPAGAGSWPCSTTRPKNDNDNNQPQETPMRTALLAWLALAALATTAAQAAAPAYKITDRIAGPDGGWDYVRVDPGQNRVLVTRGNTIMAVDLKTKAASVFASGQRIHIALPVNDGKEILITNGGDNTAIFVDAKTGKVLTTVAGRQGAGLGRL